MCMHIFSTYIYIHIHNEKMDITRRWTLCRESTYECICYPLQGTPVDVACSSVIVSCDQAPMDLTAPELLALRFLAAAAGPAVLARSVCPKGLSSTQSTKLQIPNTIV